MVKKRIWRRWFLFLLSWWIVMFPEMVFCSGMCTAYQCENDRAGDTGDEAAAGGSQQVRMDGEALRELLFRAEPEQIEYKSFLWEFLSQKKDAEE